MSGRRLNQFSFWPGLKEDTREGGYFAVMYDTRKQPPKLEQRLTRYFGEVSYIGSFPLYKQKGEAQKACTPLPCKRLYERGTGEWGTFLRKFTKGISI